MLTRLRLPLSLPLWELASWELRRLELHAHLGEPHFIETDSTRTVGGDEEAWAYTLDSGQRILIILEVPRTARPITTTVRLIADPLVIAPLLQALGIEPEDPKLNCYTTPFPLD